MTTAVSQANCEFWPFLTLKHQRPAITAVHVGLLIIYTAPVACGKTKCKWHSLVYQMILLSKPQ